MATIVAFDLETTGLDKQKDQIIQFAGVKFDLDTKKILKKIKYLVKPVGSYTISIQAYVKHGIKPETLENEKTFAELAKEIYDFIEDSDAILSYNGTNFDVPFLKNEFAKAGIEWNVLNHKFYDAFLEEKRRNGNRLEETYERYYGKTMEESGLQAHDALSDVIGTIGVFYAQQKNETYETFTPLTEDNFIKEMPFRDKIEPCFTIGKYKDLPVSFVKQIDKGYIDWCCSDKATFCESTKAYLKNFA
jgi:DNA polymerase-3 subunit epsilon